MNHIEKSTQDKHVEAAVLFDAVPFVFVWQVRPHNLSVKPNTLY